LAQLKVDVDAVEMTLDLNLVNMIILGIISVCWFLYNGREYLSKESFRKHESNISYRFWDNGQLLYAPAPVILRESLEIGSEKFSDAKMMKSFGSMAKQYNLFREIYSARGLGPGTSVALGIAKTDEFEGCNQESHGGGDGGSGAGGSGAGQRTKLHERGLQHLASQTEDMPGPDAEVDSKVLV
jgi:hypothetical protein